MRWVFVLTVFLGSFLLFQVQPLIGKRVLPWFGGSAAVWTTCLLFFQVGLLAGYAWAHGLVRALSPARQRALHLTLLGLSLLALPVLPDLARAPAGDAEPLGALLGLLATSVGLPYLALAANGPLLQAWHARAFPDRDPYRLFALSNLASLAALLAYPFVFEPSWPLATQAQIWTGLYLVFVAGCGLLAWRAPSFGEAARVEEEGGEHAALPTWLVVLLAALPSALLLAVTAYLTSDIAPIPLLWVVPLALYLVSFVLVFESERIYRRWWAVPALLVAVGTALSALAEQDLSLTFTLTLPALVATLFLACLVCHGELARRRPAPARLTGFYLAIAAGGALGGLAVAVAAPLALDAAHELPLLLIALPALVLLTLFMDPEHPWHAGWRRLAWPAGAGLVLLAGIQAGQALLPAAPAVTLQVRNFYGPLEVLEQTFGRIRVRVLRHGGIEHGSQALDPGLEREPTTYYGRPSGVGRVLGALGADGPLKVGVVGLGTGTLAAYARAGDTYRFYEINPLVEEVARAHFTWLSDARGRIEVVPGDARLSLDRETPQAYDALVLDAFTGDAIPVHLLTREAFAVYARHLKPDGFLLVHTSNRYLALNPLVKIAAESQGWTARAVETDEDPRLALNWSEWVIVGAPDSPRFPVSLWIASTEILVPTGLVAWTDDHSSLFPSLIWDQE